MTPALSAFQEKLDAFMCDRSPDRSMKPVFAAIAGLWSAKEVTIGICGPILAVMIYAARTKRIAWWMRGITRLNTWVVRKTIWKDRPLWNDYHMVLWLLSREQWAVDQLYWHLRHANRRRISGQAFTGDWMVASVAQQDPEFAAHWMALIDRYGYWHPTPPGEFAASLGDDPAILERVYERHPECLKESHDG